MNLGLLTNDVGVANTINYRNEVALKKIHTTTTTWGPLASWLLKVRTHAAVTVKLPYMIYFGNATYPGGLTAAPATSAQALVGIAYETTSAAAWSWMYVAGYVADVVSSGSVAAGADVEVLNGGVAVIDAGGDHPVLTANGIGWAMDAAASNVVDVWLLGKYVNLAGS